MKLWSPSRTICLFSRLKSYQIIKQAYFYDRRQDRTDLAGPLTIGRYSLVFLYNCLSCMVEGLDHSDQTKWTFVDESESIGEK